MCPSDSKQVVAAALALFVLAALPGFAADATEAPVGAHHAGHGPDNGGGRGYTAQVPLELPPARGGLPIPLTLTVGGTRVGALGRGGDVQLSFISDVSSFAELRPVPGPDAGTVARRRVTLSLLGDSMELMLHSVDANGENWVAQRNHPELAVRKRGPVWRVYTGDGLTYTFNQPTSALQPLGLFLLDRIEGPAGAKVLLEYWIWSRKVTPASNLPNHPLPLPGYGAVTINLAHLRYNYASTGSPKHELILSYDGELAQPLSVSVMGAGVLIRNMKLRSIDVTSRAQAMGPLTRLARYRLLYGVDPDTRLPRLESVTTAGRLGTPEATQELPVVRYEYGQATTPISAPDAGTDYELRYQELPLVPLPLGASSQLLSSSEKDGARYVTPQQLIDVTGDGRADVVFKTGAGLSVGRNRPGSGGQPVLNDPTLTGPFNGGAMTKKFLDSFQVPQTFDPVPQDFLHEKTDSITDTRTQLLDVNGDGRPDYLDAAEVSNVWVIYLNTPAPNAPQNTKWVRTTYNVMHIRKMLEARGNVLPAGWVPLMRQYTGARISSELCFEWSHSAHRWETDFSNDCDALAGGADLLPRTHYQGATTIVAWRLADFNSDGAADLLMASIAPRTETWNEPPCLTSGVHHEPTRPECYEPTGNVRHAIGHRMFRQPPLGELLVSLNDRDVSTTVPMSGGALAVGGCGAGRWGTIATETTNFYGTPYVAKESFEDCALEDVNGDGLLDAITGVSVGASFAYDADRLQHVAYLGTGGHFSAAYLALPGSTHYAPIERCLTYNGQPTTSGSYTAETRIGYRDVTGDGIPDSIGHFLNIPSSPKTIVRIGTGAGFAPPIRIAGALDGSSGHRFLLSKTENACDQSSSRTVSGAYDVDGDGRPELVQLSGWSLDLFQVVGRSGTTPEPRALSAGLLTAIENGHGARTEISYRSAKDDGTTQHQVPFPEIVVGSTRTVQKSTGQTAETLYAYGKARLEFDSMEQVFHSYGYGRTIAMTKVGPGRDPASPIVEGVAVVTDAWPLVAPVDFYDTQAAFGRHLIAGRPKTVSALSGLVTDPWAMLTVDVASDSRVVAATQLEYAARISVAPGSFSLFDYTCYDIVDPYQVSVITAMSPCKTSGFAFQSAVSAWRGRAGPPSDMNVMTHSRVLEVDAFGRMTRGYLGNDARRGDDNLCVQLTWATSVQNASPYSWDGRVLDAVAEASVRQANVDGACTGATLTKTTQAYDGLPVGQVLNGFLTTQWSDRRDTQTGVLLDPAPVRSFDVQYDAFGNVIEWTSSSGDGRTRKDRAGYDPFGLVRTSSRTSATGAATLDTLVEYDPYTLRPLFITGPNQSRTGLKYDGFGRPLLSTFAPPGGSEGVVAITRWLGFEGGDPQGRRVVETTFDVPVPPAQAPATPGHTATTWLDDFGRASKTVVDLGSDYPDDLVVEATTFDPFGRVQFVADPFPTSQNAATAYGTTHFFATDGTLKATVRGHGKQPLPPSLFGSTNEAAERYPTFYSHDFSAGQEVFGLWTPDALLSGSPQAGVMRLTRATAIGRVLTEETWGPSTRLEHVEVAHDALGNRISMTRYRTPGGTNSPPAEPVRWTFGYDSFGQVLRQLEPNTAQRDNLYSDWGELLEVKTNASGSTPARTRVRRYDGLGRLTHAEQLSNGVVLADTSYDYAYDFDLSPWPALRSTNTLGRLSLVQGITSDTWFSYDAYGHRSAEVRRDPKGELYVQSATYTVDGELQDLQLSLTDNGGDPATSPSVERVKYGYDSAHRLRSAKFVDAAGGRSLYQAFGIDAFGRVLGAWVGKALYEASYANTGRRLLAEERITSPSGVLRAFYVNAYDPVGRERSRSEKTEWSGDDLTSQYDALGRLSRSVRTGALPWDRAFTYDALGNLVQQVDVTGPLDVAMRYATGAAANRDQLCSIGYGVAAPAICNVGHDAVGNLTELPTRTGSRKLGYLPSGRVSWVASSDGTSADFRYDGLGSLQELDVVGPALDTRADRRYGLAERREVKDDGVSVLTRHLPVGEVTATRHGPTDSWTFAIGEARGNRFFVDGSGELVQAVDYLPYGEPLGNGAKPGSALYSRAQWNGGDHLDAFGLTSLGARLYDPVLGRFLSPDPLVLMGGANASNPYAFGFDDPLSFADPTGECPEGCGTTGTPGQSVGDPNAPTRDVEEKAADAPVFKAALAGLPALGSFDPNALENKVLVEGIEPGTYYAVDARVLRRRAYEAERIRRSEADLAQLCKRVPASCDDKLETGFVADAARGFAGMFLPPIAPPSYYLRRSDSRVLQLDPESGVEYFRVRDQQMGAAAYVAAGRFNDRVQQVFSGAMELSGAMIGLGFSGMKGGPTGVPVPIVAPPAAAGGCFAADTPVLTESGPKPISGVSVGERVWSFVDARGEWGWHAVTDVLIHQHSGPMVVLQSGDDRIVATPNHPVCVGAGAGLESRAVPDDIGGDPVRCGSGGRWVTAGELHDGDLALGARGVALVLRGSAGEQSRLVYNLQVEEAHSYVIGASGLLVHNKPMMIRAETVAEGLGFEKTNYTSHGQAVFKKGNLYISRDVGTAGAAAGDNPFVLGHKGGYWKMASGSPKNLGSKTTRMGTYDMGLRTRLGD